MKMSLGAVFLAALVSSGISPASADELKWEAMQWVGTQRDCDAKYMNARWQILETGSRVTLQPDSRTSSTGWRLSSYQLNPDGSGRVTLSYHNGRPAWFEFTSGHGPRTIFFNYNYQACVWQLHPV